VPKVPAAICVVEEVIANELVDALEALIDTLALSAQEEVPINPIPGDVVEKNVELETALATVKTLVLGLYIKSPPTLSTFVSPVV